MLMPLVPFAVTLAAPVVLTFMQVMGGMYTDYTAAPPQTTYAWAWSYVMPETTDVNQFYELVGNAFSSLQIPEYWNSYMNFDIFCWANEVFWREKDQEMSLYDKLQSFPYFWRICGSLFRRVVEIVFWNFCGQAGLKLRAIDFLRYLWFSLFNAILHRLWTY